MVAVVVPILNEARYIREALDSLLTQDYHPLDVVVYDGGSTDGTLDILRDYPVELVVEPGLSQVAAINRGWRRTRADFVTWMAGDDVYKPGAIRRLAEELLAHPEAGFVHADAEIIDEAGALIKRVRPGQVTLRDLVRAFEIIPQTALIRRAALERAGMLDERRRFAADWDLFLRLAQYYPSRYAPFTAAARRLHSGSEDVQNVAAVGEAAIDVIGEFFSRTDLTREQRALWRHGFAGSRLTAAWCYCVSGRRRQAWKVMLEGLVQMPQILLTLKGLKVLARLLTPFRYPAPWERVGG